MTQIQLQPDRKKWLDRSKHLQWMTVGWNAIEAVVALAAAMASGSVALLAFGLDSIIETSSGLVILWRIRAEKKADSRQRIERVEDLARRGVSLTLWALGFFVTVEAVQTLIDREEPSSSPVGISLLVLSVAVMWWLAREKRVVATHLHSHAMEADAAQTSLCFKLSITALAGLALNAVFGLWWADPVAALGVVGVIFLEARRAWQGRSCCQ